VLRWLTDRTLAESIAGDLAEERRRRASARSPIAAAFWFWRSSLAVTIYFLSRRIRDTLSDFARSLQFGSRGEWRQSLRSLRRTPWYSLAVILVIALSLTLATTVFAIVDGVLFKPLPYPRAEELYTVRAPYSLAVSARDVREWAAAVPEAPMALLGPAFTVGSTIGDRPLPVTGAEVGPGALEILGVRPLMGGFRPEHFIPSGGRVPVLISYRFWQGTFGRDSSVVGKPLDLVGPVDHLLTRLPGLQVAGVLPHDFVFPNNRDTPDVILPLAIPAERDGDRNTAAGTAIVRIPSDVPVAVVRSRIEAVTRTQGFRDANFDRESNPSSPDVSLSQVSNSLTLYTGGSFRTAFVAAGVLVLIAVVNVSSLALARGRQRRSELALRQALGASRRQLARLALREVGPLVAIGSTLGVAGAQPLIAAVTSVIGRIVLLKTPEIDWRVVAFAATTAVIQTLVVVAATTRALPASRVAEVAGRGVAVTIRRRWSSFSLVSLQVGLTLVLAIGGVLAVGSWWWAWQQDPGIDPDRVILLDVTTGSGSAADRSAQMNAVLDRVNAMPGIESVATVGFRFLTSSHLYYSFKWPDGAPPNREEPIHVGGDFFSMLGMRAIDGRLPTAADLIRDPDLAVVSARVARRHWPGRRAVGRTFQLYAQTLHIVAVVPDARFSSLDDATYGQVYLPPLGAPGVVLAKARTNPEVLLRSLLVAVRSLGAPVGITRAVTLKDAYGSALQRRTFYTWFFGGFATCAIVIVAVGILGLAAMTTAMRTKEMGIRLALGATADGLVGLLLREQLRAVAAGLAGGVLVAAWAVRFMKGYMYQFTVYDTRLWAAAVATILVTAMLGAFLPSLRASRVDPVTALRVD
jgi:predicted permease